MPRKSAKEKRECYIHDIVITYSREKIRQNVCVNEDDYPFLELNGKHYCLFHYPGDKDCLKFEEIFRKKLDWVEQEVARIRKIPEEKQREDKSNLAYNFQYVYFPSIVDLIKRNFEVKVDFWSATFTQDVYLREAIFNEDVLFNWAKFLETSKILCLRTRFYKKVDFQYAVVGNRLTFKGGKGEEVFLNNTKKNQNSVLILQDAQFEKPERVSFYRVRLYPNWFVNIDLRKMIFTDVIWENLDRRFDNQNIINEFENCKNGGIFNPERLLETACRQLAINAEENSRYEEASKFRQMANETKRFEEVWWKQIKSLHWWYWLSSFYGESWKQALSILVGVLLFFSIIYMLIPFQVCPVDKPLSLSIQQNLCEIRSLGFGEAVLHSLATATFQNIEYQKPVTIIGEILRILEKIFAPLQAALLALAIRRKFMR